jgi:hypothetical protein
MWRRDEDLRVESAVDAERFIEDVGFANTLTDTRRAGPSFRIAVSDGDVSLPRSIQKRRQKNEESRLTWYLKDDKTREQGQACDSCDSQTFIRDAERIAQIAGLTPFTVQLEPRWKPDH